LSYNAPCIDYTARGKHAATGQRTVEHCAEIKSVAIVGAAGTAKSGYVNEGPRTCQD
jgi:hypothetical protein